MDFYIDDPSFHPKQQGFDVTVISPHSQPYVSSPKSDAGFALKIAEAAKRHKYGSLCADLNLDFHPMAIDIYGSIGPGFGHGVDCLVTYISHKRGSCPSSERRSVILQLSSLVQQRTAVSINRRRLNFHAVDG